MKDKDMQESSSSGSPNGLFDGVRVASLALVAALLSLTASAETWLLTTNQDDKYGATDAQYNMQYWTSVENGTNGLTSSELVPGDDYIVEKKYQLSLKENYVFVGNKLTIGCESTGKTGTLRLRGSKITFPNEGVFLYKGSMINLKYRSSTASINAYSNLLGKVTVTAPKSDPFVFTSSYHNLFLYMDGELIGDSTAGFQVGAATTRLNCLFTVNHADRYFGDITVVSGRANTPDRNFGYGLGLGPSTYPGRIALLTSGTILYSPRAGVNATVNALEFSEGSYLRFYYDPATEKSGFIDVTGSLTLPESPLVVQAEYTPVFSTTGEDVRCAILRGPAGVRLDPAQFAFDPNAAFEPGSGKAPQRIHFEVETDTATNRDTLYAVVEPVVKLLSGDGNERDAGKAMANGTSLTNAVKWGDGRLPHANAHYYVAGYLNSTFDNEDYVFPGRSLIYNGGTFHLFGNHRLSFPIIEGGNLRFRGCSSAGNIAICGGKLYAKGSYVSFAAYASHVLRVESEIVGNARVELGGESGTSSHHGIFEFAAFNTNSFGRVYFNGVYDRTLAPNFSEGYLTLNLFDERNLGAALPEFMFNALDIGVYCEVAVTNDVMLSAAQNRGIFVTRGGARFKVAEGATLDCRWPVTLDAPLWKDGAGTLALGGTPGFAGEVGGVTNRVETLPADASKRLLIVTNGYVKALSPDCVNGLTVSLAQNRVTGLVVDYATEDETLARYGFRNVKTDTPFVGDTIRVVVENAGQEALAAASCRDKLGLITVKTDVADYVERRLVVLRQSRRVSGILREDDAETELTTFSMPARRGFMLMYR